MNKNVLIVLGGAVVVAVLVALLVQLSFSGKKDAPVVEEAKIEILVADKDLGIGRELKDGDLRWQEWPKNSVFPGAITRQEGQEAAKALEGRLARNIAKGEPVMRSALLGQAKGNFVAASLEPGMRAVAIEVSAASTAGGFIGPGDYVDVILTYKDSLKTEEEDPRIKNMIELNLDKLATETILQNVKVLAVDQTAQRPDEEKIKVGKTVTLAVSAKDAERLALAVDMGPLILSLRAVGDDETVKRDWPIVTDGRLTNVSDEIMAEVQKLKKETGVRTNNVRIYNGAQIQVIPSQ